MALLGRSIHDFTIRVQSIRTNVFITADPGAIPAGIRNPGVTCLPPPGFLCKRSMDSRCAGVPS